MSRRVAKKHQSGGEHETYETPAWCVDRLLDDVYLPAGRWLEPGAGSGAIIRAVNRRIPGVNWTAVETRDAPMALLHEAAGAHCAEFLSWAEERLALGPGGRGRDRLWHFDVVVMNPPYSRAQEFIDACRKLAPIVVALLRVNYLASAKRHSLHRLCMPSEGWLLPDRPSFFGSGGDATEYAWFVYTPHAGPECRMRVLGTTPVEVRRPGTQPRRPRKDQVTA